MEQRALRRHGAARHRRRGCGGRRSRCPSRRVPGRRGVCARRSRASRGALPHGLRRAPRAADAALRLGEPRRLEQRRHGRREVRGLGQTRLGRVLCGVAAGGGRVRRGGRRGDRPLRRGAQRPVLVRAAQRPLARLPGSDNARACFAGSWCRRILRGGTSLGCGAAWAPRCSPPSSPSAPSTRSAPSPLPRSPLFPTASADPRFGRRSWAGRRCGARSTSR